MILTYLIVFALGFGFGSAPFGVLLTRLAGTKDLRSIGSGNIGATNVLRTGHKGLALATLLLDGFKATVAIWIAQRYFGNSALAGPIAGLGAIFGHILNPWLGFKGGKGAATAAGAIMTLCWPAGLATAVTWISCLIITRYSSLGAIIASLLLPVYAWFFSDLNFVIWCTIVSSIVLIKHKDNIVRLWTGRETKIGEQTNENNTQ